MRVSSRASAPPRGARVLRPRPAPGAPSGAGPRRARRWVLPVAVVAALLVAGGALLLGLRTSSAPTDAVVATVDGHDVTAAEVAFQADRLRASVQNELQVAAGSTGEPVDWSADLDGRTGREVLLDRALAQAVADKQLLLLAQEAGVVEDVDFASFASARGAENDRRAGAVAQGEVVYGLTRFGEEEFYEHTLADVRTRVQQVLSAEPGGPLHVTAAEVEAAYAAEPGAWTANVTTYDLTCLTVPVVGDREAERAALAAATAGADLAAVAAAHPGAVLAAETLGPSGASALTPPQEQTLQQVAGLAAGDVTAPADDGDRLVVLRVDAVAVDADRALSEYGSRIRAGVVAEKLDGLLARRGDDSDVVVDRTALATTDLASTDLEDS